ncbi:MAG: hypothetical protein WDN69_04170 [Aliidongia sp.]
MVAAPEPIAPETVEPEPLLVTEPIMAPIAEAPIPTIVEAGRHPRTGTRPAIAATARPEFPGTAIRRRAGVAVRGQYRGAGRRPAALPRLAFSAALRVGAG